MLELGFEEENTKSLVDESQSDRPWWSNCSREIEECDVGVPCMVRGTAWSEGTSRVRAGECDRSDDDERVSCNEQSDPTQNLVLRNHIELKKENASVKLGGVDNIRRMKMKVRRNELAPERGDGLPFKYLERGADESKV